MRAAFRLRRDNREHDRNAAVYNQLFDGCGSCFHNDRSSSGQIRRRGGVGGGVGGGWDVVRIIKAEC